MGHTASLFPRHTHPESSLALPVLNAPKPPSERVSLSAACLSNNDQLLILITGQSKHDSVIDWISGEMMPVKTISTNNRTFVYCDRTAWDWHESTLTPPPLLN